MSTRSGNGPGSRRSGRRTATRKASPGAARPEGAKGAAARSVRGPHGGGGQGPGNVYGGERGARKGRPSTPGARRPRLGPRAQGAKRGGAGRGALSKTAAGRKPPRGSTRRNP